MIYIIISFSIAIIFINMAILGNYKRSKELEERIDVLDREGGEK